jgi:hypothetical protein
MDYTIRHEQGHTIYEDEVGGIVAPGYFYSREQLESAMFDPANPVPFLEVDRT